MNVLGIGFREAVTFLAGDEARPAPARQMARQHIPSEDEARREAFIHRQIATIVRKLVPVRGSSGEEYLRETRCIDTDAIADVLERTDAIGWHPAVFFNEPGHARHGQRLGCIVGVMTDALTAQPTGAISRTYIGADLRKVAKAKTLGSPAGVIRLSEDADVLYGLSLAEGLESALAAMAKGFRPCWSTGSDGLMAGFPVLPVIESLTVFADHDRNGAGLRAAREAEARWLQAGREVSIKMRDQLGDINDALMMESES